MKSVLVPGKKVTMLEIAKRLHMSKSTVSRAFSRPDLLDAKTVDRVLKSAEKLKFRPNVSAKVLSSGKTNLIAVLLPTLNYFTGEYLTMVLYGIGLELERNGCSMVFHGYDHADDKGGSIFHVLRRADVEGALVFTRFISGKQIDELSAPPVPTVAVDILTDIVPCVYSDNYGIGYSMTEHLIGMGHRRIACLIGDSEWENAMERRRGAIECLEKHGIDTPPEWKPMCKLDGGFEYSIKEFSAILSSSTARTRPTAVVTATDEIASGVYKVAERSGLKIPGDISVISCDNNHYCKYLSPTLTSVEQNGCDLGIKAARMLVGKLPASKLSVNHHIVDRESVRKL